jgi:hypothetical protein
MARVEVKTRRWKRVEYERLIETGFFQPGDPIELVGGQLIVAESQGSGHFAAIQAVEEALRAAFGQGWQVRGQGPLALDDYWIVNLVDRVLEVCRNPGPDPAASFGWRYQSVETFERGASVSPLALPGVHIHVGDLLP